MDDSTATPSSSSAMGLPDPADSHPSRKSSHVQDAERKRSQPPSQQQPQIPMFMDPLDLEQARASLTGRKPFIRPPMDNRANAPQRKNGLFLSGAAQGSDGVSF